MTNSDSMHRTSERVDLLDAIDQHRSLFLVTVAGLTDEQARVTPTASSLCLGGLVKHLTATETEWLDFIVDGAETQPSIDWESVDWSDPPPAAAAYADQFRMRDEESLDGLLAAYAEVATRTESLLAETDLDARHSLPAAPWFEAGSSWTARRVILHLVAEISQHAGHADILRESIDGQRTMG